MNNLNTNCLNKIKGGFPIIVTAWLSLIISVFINIYYFNITKPLLITLPVILWTLYTTFLHRKANSFIWGSIAIGLISTYSVYEIFNDVDYYFQRIPFGLVLYIVLFAALCALISVGTMNLSNKAFAVTCATACIVLSILTIIRTAYFNLMFGGGSYLILLNQLSIILFGISVILFCTNNPLPAVSLVKVGRKSEKAEIESPDIALKNLKRKMELGFITEEEFQTQKEELLKKL